MEVRFVYQIDPRSFAEGPNAPERRRERYGNLPENDPHVTLRGRLWPDSRMTDGAADALLLETFGLRLLAYLCNVDEGQVEDRLLIGTPLPAASETALPQLAALAERVARERANNPGLPMALSLDFLAEVPQGQDTSIANLLRSSAGGQAVSPAPEFSDGDEVKMLLLRLGRDAYPQLLVPSDHWPIFRLSLFRHPLSAALQSAVHQDPEFSSMYPSEDDGLGRRGLVYSSLGRGGSVQSVMFGETVIQAAWDLALMRTPTPSVDDLYESIVVSVDTLRSAIRGERTTTRGLLAFTGITTGGRSILTPWGQLRPMTEAERSSAPPMLDGAVSGTDSQGRSVTVAYAGEVVLDTALPFEVSVRSWPEGEDFPSFPLDRSDAAKGLQRRLEAVQLAVLLGAERPEGQLATARCSWHWVADPTSQGRSMGWVDPRSSPGFMPTELSADECAAVAEMCDLLDRHWRPSMDIAVRRTLSAAQTRTDPSDRLVDAVIAWENLFGTSEGEPRLRISAAMAWLLADTAAERRELQREIRQLYDDRSKIVHGGVFDEVSIAPKANRALDLAILSLRELFRSRSDVLALSDGAARSIRLMLG